MNETDLRELDGWIAEFFLGDEWRSKNMDRRWLINPRTKVYFQCPMFSVDPSAFALVKREIERRGWGWACYRDKGKGHYLFEISFGESSVACPAASEELAGCLAIKAVERSDG